MARRHRINPHHQVQRSGLRLIGWVMTIVGGLFTAVGLISFFGAFAGGGMPQYFWCAFVGIPLLGVGAMLLKLGYMGAIARYVAGEAAPVATDAVNFVAGETTGSVRRIAGAIADGLRGGAAADPGVPCRSCGHENDADARFCDQCGSALSLRRACPSCHEVNDADARFCDGCGAALA